MARRYPDGTPLAAKPKLSLVRPEHVENAAKLSAWCEAKKPPAKKRSAGIGDAAFLRDLDAVVEFLKNGKWAEATGRHFVALYADLHFRVYGIAPGDLGSKERAWAAKMANDLLAQEFGGDKAAMARFISWTWSRELDREKWRRQENRGGGRIDYRMQFGKRMLVDFRIDEARQRKTS